MNRFSRSTFALGIVFLLSTVLSAQLPGPPVGIPQTNQNFSYGYNFQYTFIPTSTTGGAVRILPTLTTTTSTGNTDDGLLTGGTYAVPNATSTATQFAGLRAGTITCTANGGTITVCSNLVADAEPAGATTNFSAVFKGVIMQTVGVGVASLPACNAARRGARSVVTDANATTFHTTAAAGGANVMAVFCDGTNWYLD